MAYQDPPTSFTVLFLVWLLALAVRVGVLVTFRIGENPDLWEYEEIVANLLSGKSFLYVHFNALYRSYTEPLYPFLVAAVYALTDHSFLALGIVQVAISGLLPVVIYLIGVQIFDRTVATLAAFLVALHPGLVVYATKFHPLILDSLLISTVLWLMLLAVKAFSYRGFALLGATSGLCALTRPTILAFLPFGYLWMTRTVDVPSKKRGLFLCVALLIMTVVIAPWLIRNYAIHGQFVFSRSSASYSLWLGNNPYFSGSAMGPGGVALIDLTPPAFRQRLYASSEMEQARIFQDEALSYISQDPLAFLGRVVLKLYYFWWFSPQSGTLYPKAWLTAYRVYYIAVLAFALVGLMVSARQVDRWTPRVLVLLLLLSISLCQSIFYVEGRHRWGVESLLLIFAAYGLVSLFKFTASRMCPIVTVSQ